MKNTIISKEKEYRNYIDEHVSNVKKAFEVFINNDQCMDIFTEMVNGCGLMLDMVRENIQHHDESKYSEEEFDAYRRYFHSINENEKNESKDDFDKAWVHHYMNNGHHYDSWNLAGKEMPAIYIVEMVCDWQAMCYKFGGTTLSWYTGEQKKGDKIKLGEQTRVYVERLIRALSE